MEAHFPSFFPFSQFYQVILKTYAIDIRCYGKIYDGIISEQSGFGSYIFWHVVDVCSIGTSWGLTLIPEEHLIQPVWNLMFHLLLPLTDFDRRGSFESICWFCLLFHSDVIYGLVGCDILCQKLC
jgi:hypothetical protein